MLEPVHLAGDQRRSGGDQRRLGGDQVHLVKISGDQPRSGEIAGAQAHLDREGREQKGRVALEEHLGIGLGADLRARGAGSR